MNADLVSLADFLRNDKFSRVNIPIFQRSYDWRSSHVEQLIAG